jgi:tyrosyl-tRNA synthetase
MDLSKVQFIYASDLVKNSEYWELVLKISMNSTLNRVKRCTQIMGREDTDALTASQILYPLMQAADIFYLPADICQLGLDQRKVNMLAREVAGKIGKPKPISLSHHMLMGLGKPPDTNLKGVDRAVKLKMSKSDPDSAIFMLDDPNDVKRKINKAYCPPQQIFENPVLDYTKSIIFELIDKFKVKRPEKYGGDVEYSSFEQLENDYEKGDLNPADLKPSVINYLNQLLKPIREHFEKNPRAKQLYNFVKKEDLKDKQKSKDKK